MRGEPTEVGLYGRAWLTKHTSGQTPKPDWDASLAQWQLNVPKAHPFWSWWLVNLVHLRPIEGVRPAHKKYPEAEYEFLVMALDPDSNMALDPDSKIPDPDTVLADTVFYRYLMPPDFVHQFHGLDDTQAKELCKLAIRTVVRGGLSPDQDYRAIWKKVLMSTVEHMALGGHPKGKA